MSSITRCCWSSGMSRIPNASVAVRRSGVTTAREKYGGTVSRIARDALLVAVGAALPSRSGSENAGHSAALPHRRAWL